MVAMVSFLLSQGLYEAGVQLTSPTQMSDDDELDLFFSFFFYFIINHFSFVFTQARV